MDTGLLVAFAIAALVLIGTLLRIVRPPGRRVERRAEPRERADLVTTNLDYSILGQRPEIVTEDEPPEGR
jgi:hypothetical protein